MNIVSQFHHLTVVLWKMLQSVGKMLLFCLVEYKSNCGIYSHIFGFAGLHDVGAIFFNILWISNCVNITMLNKAEKRLYKECLADRLNHTVYNAQSLRLKTKGCLLNPRSKKPGNGYWTADGPDLAIIMPIVLSWRKITPDCLCIAAEKVTDYFEITTTDKRKKKT